MSLAVTGALLSEWMLESSWGAFHQPSLSKLWRAGIKSCPVKAGSDLAEAVTGT